ncbi:hypothetical protein GCM10010987_78790 [Bradyrhizobium guangdongense]|uniref:Uncharacterized protein n=1 Tax=Bradyrhizobium guangdongense TaxID=1325090 RepID=A0AA87WCH8_9BRAD|nr:hypothetical protein GCM10010987_78790 [Bradyrhizobium guangdongense]
MLLTPILRELIESGTVQISDPSWTEQAAIDLAKQLSKAPKGEIENPAIAAT